MYRKEQRERERERERGRNLCNSGNRGSGDGLNRKIKSVLSRQRANGKENSAPRAREGQKERAETAESRALWSQVHVGQFRGYRGVVR